MANLTGDVQAISGDTSVIDTAKMHPLGTRAKDTSGNEYIYLQGVASTVAGDWVTFDEDGITTRSLANAVGRVGVAMAAIVASSYGWYQIAGKNTIAKAVSGGAAAANVALYLTATAGTVDDVDVVGDMIVGALNRVAESSGIVTVELNYPMVFNVAID